MGLRLGWALTPMATLYDVAHFCSWNGYAEDMRSYLGVDKAAWTNEEFWFPFGVNLTYGVLKKTRLQIICDKSSGNKLLSRAKELLDVRANPDISDAEGKTPLMVCCHFESPERTKIAKLLLNAGANPNKTDISGWTPLMYSSFHKTIDMTKELIGRGANINAKTSCGTTPISIAVSVGHLAVVKYLVSQGAEITDDDFEDVIKKNKVEMLNYFHKLGLRAPAMSICHAVEYKRYNIIGLLKKMGASVNGVGDDIPLVDAIDDADYDAMRELCKAGANVNILHPHYNTTPIYSAIMKPDVKAIKILCEYKVDLNTVLNDQFPLHYSISLAFSYRTPEYIDCVKEIIKGGPDFSLLNNWGENAAQSATERGLDEIVILIKRAEMKARFAGVRR